MKYKLAINTSAHPMSMVDILLVIQLISVEVAQYILSGLKGQLLRQTWCCGEGVSYGNKL
jgi:hypothetical protein